MLNFRKSVSVILALLTLLGCTFVFAGATLAKPDAAIEDGTEYSDPTYPANVDEVVSYLTEQFEKQVTDIDLTQLHIKQSEALLYNIVFNEIPASFNLDEFKPYYSSYYYTNLVVTYRYSKEEYNTLEKAFRANIDYLLRDLKTSGLSDEIKALLVHDRLIAWTAYDFKTYDSDAQAPNNDTAFGPIVKRKAVCSGYARAYRLLLGELGIKCDYLDSNALNHGWNIVTIGGKRYHVDTTWDDPVGNIVGLVKHDYFLRSTNGLKSDGKHNTNDFDTSPVDTKYDSYWWQGISSEIQYFNGALYYFREASGELIKRIGNTETVAMKIDDYWPAPGDEPGVEYFYSNKFARLCSDGDRLYYNTKDKVYSIDKSGNVKLVYTPALPKGNYIFGLNVYNGVITVYYQKNADWNTALEPKGLDYKYKEAGNTDEYPDQGEIDDIIGTDDPGNPDNPGGNEDNVSFFVKLIRAIGNFFKAIGAFFAGLFA